MLRYSTSRLNVLNLTIAVVIMFFTAYVGLIFLAIDPAFVDTDLYTLCVGGFALSLAYVVLSTTSRALNAMFVSGW
jgi:hypothetical protein